MTYYEELGVAPTASMEEIRHAYRQLARLVHPDHFLDEEARQLAHLQMKRLNGILAVLIDQDKRRCYDVSLSPRVARRRFSGVRDGREICAAFAVALLCIAVCFRPGRPAVSLTPAATKSPIPPPTKTESRDGRMPPPTAAPAGGGKELPKAMPDAPEFAPIQPTVATELIPVNVYTVPPKRPRIEDPGPHAPTLAGCWLFIPLRTTKLTGYAPEYIELRLHEAGGLLHGLYQSRYRVGDRAISPSVDFRFSGRAGPEGGVMPWQGPAGSEGEVTLKLLSAGSLEVSWVARQLGQDLGLVSGTATLVRKQE